MKRKLRIQLYILLLGSFSTSLLFGQSFAPIGAEWHYHAGFGGNDWYRLVSESDTVIGGKYFTVLEQYDLGINLNPNGRIYIHENNNRIYFYENGACWLLYDFNLQAGDTATFWIPQNNIYYDPDCSGGPPGSKIVIIDTVTTIMVSGQQKQMLHTQRVDVVFPPPVPWDSCHRYGKIIEGIGSTLGFLGGHCSYCLGTGYLGGLNCYSNGVISYSTGNCIPLSVDLVSFEAEVKATGNELNWTTESEENSSCFEVQIMKDAIQWESIGRVSAAGNNIGKIDYKFYDKNPSKESLYRLKMFDLDQTFKYSKIISVKRTSELEDIMVKPNPTSGEVHVFLPMSEEIISVEVVSATGRRVLESTDLDIDLSDVAQGVYFLVLRTSEGIKFKRIIKQ